MNATAAPQPQPGELERSKVSCATLAGHLDQGGKQSQFSGGGNDTRVCSQVMALPCQPLHMLLERCCAEDVGLSGNRDVNARVFSQHTRSPLGTHQVTPGST